MPPGFSGNLIFAIIARMLCGNHLNLASHVFAIKHKEICKFVHIHLSFQTGYGF